MRNNMFKTMKGKVSDVCRKVLLPAFMGAFYLNNVYTDQVVFRFVSILLQSILNM